MEQQGLTPEQAQRAFQQRDRAYNAMAEAERERLKEQRKTEIQQRQEQIDADRRADYVRQNFPKGVTPISRLPPNPLQPLPFEGFVSQYPDEIKRYVDTVDAIETTWDVVSLATGVPPVRKLGKELLKEGAEQIAKQGMKHLDDMAERAAKQVAKRGDDVVKQGVKRADDAAKQIPTTGIRQTFNSIRDAPTYPSGFREIQNGIRKVNINNQEVLNKLRNVRSGAWKKVYRDGLDAQGNRISIHYFQHAKSGAVFNVKVKNGWSN